MMPMILTTSDTKLIHLHSQPFTSDQTVNKVDNYV